MRTRSLCALALLLATPRAFADTDGRTTGEPFCRGAYADSLLALSAGARTLAEKHYSYCIRNTVTYDCVAYDASGRVAHSTRTAISHGTGFAFRRERGRTLLLTNHHVAEYPSITDADHVALGVPEGCKRISESLTVVDNESDRYSPDDISLTTVASAPLLDAQVLAAPDIGLNVMPWKLGRSADLRERNVVEVRGFPLGVLWAVSDGKVVHLHDHDTDKDRDHDDFITDALLAEGNSGSPVLAVSCKTGEFELVGVHHASYVGAKALNAVVSIDELRDLMTDLRVKPRRSGVSRPSSTPMVAEDAIAAPSSIDEAFFPFGSLVGGYFERSRARFLFALFPKDFPLHTEPVLAIEDTEVAGESAALGRVWIGDPDGLRIREARALDQETKRQLAALLQGMRHVAAAASGHRVALRRASNSREDFDAAMNRGAALDHVARSEDEAAQLALGLADRFKTAELGEDLLFRAVLSGAAREPHRTSIAVSSSAPPRTRAP